MEKGAAQELLISQLYKTVDSIKSGEQLQRIYTIHRKDKPPVQTVIPAQVAESEKHVRNIVRCLSDLVSGYAVSVIVPVSINSPGVDTRQGIVAAISWRGKQDTEMFFQAYNIEKTASGEIDYLNYISNPNIENFLNQSMENVLSPVEPDSYSQEYAKKVLIKNGFSPESLEQEETDEDYTLPTLH